MKSKIYLLVISVLLFACKEEEKDATAKNSVALEQKVEQFSEIPDPTSVNIKDIFLLLPDDALPMDGISMANRKLLLNLIGDEKAFDISPTPIDICDVKNGYLSLTGMQSAWEMCYWNMKDGRKLVAVNRGTETGSKIRSFFYQNGKLTEDPNYQLGGSHSYILSDFIDVSQLSNDTRKFAEKQFDNGAYNLYYQLPQKGTSLKLNIDTDQLMDFNEKYEIPYEATKEVILNWKNETWER